MIDIDVSKIVSEIGEPKARFIESEEEKQQKKMIFVFSSVFLGIFIIGTIIFAILLSVSTASAERLSSDVDQLKIENDQLLSVERQALAAKKRNQSALSLIENNANWSYLFEELERITPKNIFFTRLEVTELSAVRVSGIAVNYQVLSLLMLSLENSDMFQRVNLSNASLSVKDTGILIDFVVDLTLVGDITRKSLNPPTTPEKDSKTISQEKPDTNNAIVPEEPKQEEIAEEKVADEAEQASGEAIEEVIEENNNTEEQSAEESLEPEEDVLPVL